MSNSKRMAAFSRPVLVLLLVMAMLLPGAMMVAAAGPVKYVDAALGSDTTGDGTLAHPYKTIQKGLDDVDAGGTVYVAAGVYAERLIITKAVTLKGASAGVSKKGYVVPASYAYNAATESIIRPTTAAEQAVVDIQADGVIFDGFVVAYEVALTGGVYQNLVQIGQYTSVEIGVQILNSVLGPNTNSLAQDGTMGRSGFVAVGPHAVPLKNLAIKNNKIFDAKGNGCGIMIVASYSPQYYGGSGPGYTDMRGSVIENNEITGNHRSGIEFAGGVSGEVPGGFVIQDNLITNNGWRVVAEAASLKYGNGVTFIRGGDDRALTNPSGSRFLTFSGNVISGNEKNGLYFGSQNHDLAFIDNVISNNGVGGGGYSLWDGVRVDMDELYYAPSLITIRYDILQNIVLHNNRIQGNGDYGTKVTQTPTLGPVDAENNWWGVSSGPGPVGPGAGDKVSANVDYAPWLGALVSLASTREVFCGENAVVDVNFTGVSGLYGYQFIVHYDSAKVSASGAFVNSFFDTAGGSIPGAWNAVCASGECRFAVSKMGTAAVSGSGTVARVTLTPLGVPGAFDVTVSDDILTDRDGAAIAHNSFAPLALTICGFATASGRVSLQGRGTPVTVGAVTLTDGAFGPYSTSFDAVTGLWSISNVKVMPGGTSYQFDATHSLYLGNRMSHTLNPGDVYVASDTRLKGGDAYNDGIDVNISDLACIAGAFGGPATVCGTGSSDINADGTVNILDLAIAGGNYDLTTPQVW